MNTLTGAWCRFKGWNANCFAVFNDDLYFGGNDGFVYQADVTSLDLNIPVDAVGQGAYNYFKSRGVLKRFDHLRPLVTTDSNSRPAVGISTDFKDNATLGTPTAAVIASALYDAAIYDQDVYATEDRIFADWTAINGEGHCASIHFRARTGAESGAGLWDIAQWDTGEWSLPASGDVIERINSFDVTYEEGDFM